ncbi:MAG TPA: transposase [Dissulfurispiraceae bacterium]|nr:transposase [Dissulfurispiraceae bacterium]
MPRIARAVAVGYPHHITQRGNYRQRVFDSDDDFLRYLDWLTLYSRKYSLSIWAYCLMNNHVHFIAVPHEDDALAKTFNTLHMRYSQHINMKQDQRGHLWQGRFYSCVLDERHLYAAVRYVENNPVKAGIVLKADQYRWSSAGAHVKGHADTVLSDDCDLVERIKDWPGYLRETEEPELVDEIRQCTRTGRPCGDEVFEKKMEQVLGRVLTALPRGRPRRST